MKNWSEKKIWAVYGILTFIFSLLLAFTISFMASNWKLVFLFFFFWVVIAGFTLYAGWEQTPEKRIWMIQLFGRHMAEWKPGLHFRFPFFNWMRVYANVYMGDQIMKLYMDESVKEGYGGGNVDFKDSSAPLIAFVYFQIVDAFKATYNAEDIFKIIEERMDGTIRSYLASYTMDEANRLKVQFDLGRILNEEVADKNGNLPATKKDPQETDDWKQIINEWGVYIKRITISDIIFPQSVIETREKIMKADKELEAAKIEKQTAITKAEGLKEATIITAQGKREALILEGEGIHEQIGKITAVDGLDANKVTDYLVQMNKWNKVGEGKSSVIIDNGSGIAGVGAQFAAGISTFKKPDNT
ncbi:SPFH/Band 7/PHB domain protein [Candidatus Parcubacteria bacterium]|nr:SPFH/Band 7/PHB domain protein [Patescibacteria group bacterium]MCG2690978.1 SPFH/Band 7/PHB domain protein [Candidatus Parcubacteria bacterium]